MYCVGCLSHSNARICFKCALIGAPATESLTGITIMTDNTVQTDQTVHNALSVLLSIGVDNFEIVRLLCSTTKVFNDLCKKTLFVVKTILDTVGGTSKIIDLQLNGMDELFSYVKAIRRWKLISNTWMSGWSLIRYLIVVGAFELADRVIAKYDKSFLRDEYACISAIFLNGSMEAYRRYRGENFDWTFYTGEMKIPLIEMLFLGVSTEIVMQNPQNVDYSFGDLRGDLGDIPDQAREVVRTSVTNLMTRQFLADIIKYNKDNYEMVKAFAEQTTVSVDATSDTLLQGIYNVVHWSDSEKILLLLKKLYPELESIVLRKPVKIKHPTWPPYDLPISNLQ